MNHNKLRLVSAIAAAAALLLFAAWLDQPYWRHILIIACIYSTLSMFYNILYGFIGVFNFGFAAFFGIGAYISAILATDKGVPIVAAMSLAALASGLCGFILMIPCLRMHGFSPGIVTLAFGEIVRVVIAAIPDVTKGEMGYWGIVPLFQSDQLYAVAAVSLVIVVLAGITLLMRSRIGLAFRIIKDDQQAAQTAGVNSNVYKLFAMFLSCAGAGLVGAFYAHYLLTITPSICGLGYTIQILCMSLFGGIGTLAGPVIGAVSLTFLTEALRFLEGYRFLIYGVLLVVTIMFFPKGLMGIMWKPAHSFRTAKTAERSADSHANIDD